MLWLNPNQVSFAGQTLRPVLSVRLERRGERLLAERGEGERFCSFVDACGERVELIVELEPAAWPDSCGLGEAGELAFEASLGTSDGQRVRVSAEVALIASQDTVSPKTGLKRQLRFLARSTDGSDPIIVEAQP
jgi:hypothetical protein